MSRANFVKAMQSEVSRIDGTKTQKRQEKVIEGFTKDVSPRALIDGREVRIFNSNDYLGLRHHPKVKKAEHEASELYGAGPGAVRFISGSLKVHRDLENALAKFHGREAGMIFSSAFATNMAVLFCLLKGQNKDSLITGRALVISDALNHRSIIDGIRVAGLDADQKEIFNHMDADSLREVLAKNTGKFERVIVVTDGVFSMLGEYQDLKALRKVVDEFDGKFDHGVWLVMDDAHGVGIGGETGRGTEEVSGARVDILIGTMGKAFGTDGGYVVADQSVIDFLRESAATYIYSNNIAPGTAGAALASVQIVGSAEGKALLTQSRANVDRFKHLMKEAGFTFAADSHHPIQPILIAEPVKTKALTDALFEAGFLVTNINYPVVPKGKDEIRVQLSATHTLQDIEAFVKAAERLA